MTKSIKFLNYIAIILAKYVLAKNNEDTDDNYTLYEITAYNPRERAMLYSFHIRDTNIIFLNGVTNEAVLPMNVAVMNDYHVEFENLLNMFNIQYNYAFPKSIKKRYKNPILKERRTIKNSFLDWDTMVEWVHNKCRINPYIEKHLLGKTFEKREMFALRISTGRRKPAIVVVGCEVARDWITTAVILNYINYLLSNALTDKLMEHYDFYFIPVANPDGYAYSMMEDRTWSKSRVAVRNGLICTSGKIPIGISIDRNWFWVQKSTPQNECFGVFGGQKYISEHETKALLSILNKCASELMAFINLKGFSRLITVPYANPDIVPNNYDLMIEILSAVTDKLKQNHNAHYYYGSTARLFYNYSGNCADWVKIKLNVPVVYTLYLQLGDTFFPSPTHIQPLTQQFSAILSHTMAIAGNIYGPLFNNSEKYAIDFFILLPFLVIWIWH